MLASGDSLLAFQAELSLQFPNNVSNDFVYAAINKLKTLKQESKL